MLLSATLSKPVKNIKEILGKDYKRIKIKISSSSKNDSVYIAEYFTETQVFHKKMTQSEVFDFLKENEGTTFKNAVERTENEETTILTNKKGKISRLTKKIKIGKENPALAIVASSCEQERGLEQSERKRPIPSKMILKPEQKNIFNKKKNYFIEEGNPAAFLVRLGIMNDDGKVISQKYDKFRQINRFLEILNDVLPQILTDEEKTVKIVDFGCGKSYLSFAIQYFFENILHRKAEIFGLDLKEDVIDFCNRIARELNLRNLKFQLGNIENFTEEKSPDIIITLHACDTATDFALNYAVKHNAKAILSVPCCQHEINLQLKKSSVQKESSFYPLLKYGLIKERFSALVTDCLRGEFLEKCGYQVQMLEFIDMEGTPKNLMIRAVKKENEKTFGIEEKENFCSEENSLMKELNIHQTFFDLLKNCNLFL